MATLPHARRYGAGDKVEAWLHQLLCLDAAEHVPPPPPALPHPGACRLYYVERDTLFSYHQARTEPLLLMPQTPTTVSHCPLLF
jgi:tRNA(Met) C34 N-acetyltransferase TmcA